MLSLVECTNRDLILVLTAGISLAFVGSTIYSVYFGRLAKFPGPKLAAATLCYEFYYDIVCDGRYSWKIRELHKQYGVLIIRPIVNMTIDLVRPHYSNQPL